MQRRKMETVTLNTPDGCKGVTDERNDDRHYIADKYGQVTIPDTTAKMLGASGVIRKGGRVYGGVSLPGSKSRWERQREQREAFNAQASLDN